MLVPFRRRCSFKQYMPSKPAKYSLKFSVCVMQKLDMRPYLGADNGANRATGLGRQPEHQERKEATFALMQRYKCLSSSAVNLDYRVRFSHLVYTDTYQI